ncbi:transmembrane transporter [Histoplasma capsulatum var. duboisii H88]|uniref:Transmembrane transporter n=1 Tax=Ajellomyces capsulatus (strain H88) TaxID=544711 RepID=A0A8A1LD10_AJEC8|nr:transmembrane transporter [Histoplasma capsulatum var. duboisii H88]
MILISFVRKRISFCQNLTLLHPKLLAFELAKLDGVGGYSGWRWIFIVEGLMSISLSLVTKFLIVDWPSEATFLTEEERLTVAVRLKEDVGSAKMDRLDRQSLQIIIKDWKIYTGALIYLTINTCGYSTALFNPTILKQFGYNASQSQVHSIPIWGTSAAVIMLVGYLSDRIRHRWGFVIFGCFFSSIGYILLLNQHHSSLRVKYMALFIVNIGVFIAHPVTIVWLSNNLAGHYKRAFGSAFQISFGNIGGIVASNLFLPNGAPLFRAGYGSALALTVVCALLSTVFMLALDRENKMRDAGRRDYRFNLCQAELENLGDDHPDFRFTK